jgi:uncharacterized membrane protein
MGIVQLIIIFAANAVPYIGSIINIFVSGALVCGIYIALLTQRRGENVPFSLMFEGFSRIFQTTIITLISSIPWFIFGIIMYFFISLPKMQPNPENPTEIFNTIFNRAFIVPLILGYLIVFLLSMVTSVLFFFAFPLIADRNLGLGETIKLSVAAALENIGGVLLLLILEILLSIGGALVCGVGIFFVLPVIFAANIVAYQSVFPDSHSLINTEPPRPENYGDTYGTPR